MKWQHGIIIRYFFVIIFFSFIFYACAQPKQEPTLTAPTLSVTALSDTLIKLSWNDPNTEESGYRIERSLSETGPWTQSQSTWANEISYMDSGLISGTLYYYRCRAFRTENDITAYSVYSNIVSISTFTGDWSSPRVILSFLGKEDTNFSGRIHVDPIAHDNVGVTKVEIYIDEVLKFSATTPPFIYTWDTTKVADGSHTLFAKAYDAAGNIGTSSIDNVTINNAGGGR